MLTGDELYNQIKRLSAYRNLSIRALERNSGLYRGSLSGMNRGRNKTPDLVTLSKVAETLNVSVDELVDENIESEKLSNAKLKLIDEIKDLSDIDVELIHSIVRRLNNESNKDI